MKLILKLGVVFLMLLGSTQVVAQETSAKDVDVHKTTTKTHKDVSLEPKVQLEISNENKKCKKDCKKSCCAAKKTEKKVCDKKADKKKCCKGKKKECKAKKKA